MAGPKTIFDADECQALLDLFDKCIRPFLSPLNPYRPVDLILDGFPLETTDEEKEALTKLKEAGKFYLRTE